MRHPRCEHGDCKQTDRKNDDDGLRCRIKKPVDTFRQLVCLGNETVEEGDRHNDRQYPQQDNAASDRSPPPEGLIILFGSPPAQPPCAVRCRDREREKKQGGFKYEKQHIVLVAETAPPTGHDVPNTVGRRRDVVRHPRPGLRRVDAGDRLQQARREILSTDVLDRIDEVVDVQIVGVDRSLAGRHSPR